MGSELKTGTRENHKRNKVRSNYESNYPSNGGISSDVWHSCWVYGHYLNSLPTTRRPTWASNREINQKLLTLLGQPACLTVRGSLLGLEAGTSPYRRDIDNSNRFVPRTAASETDLPEVITKPILRREGLLVECPPDQFTAPADWIPLYTWESLQKYLPAALSAFPNQGVPSLIAITPPEFWVGTDKEFLLCNFHRRLCLMRQSFNLEGRCRQLAFCPYCGVINENSDTVISHVRKHLNLQFVC